MQALFGVIFHFIGGFASGSFYIPYKKVRHWSWESYWIVGGLFSWLIVPPLAAWLTIPNFTQYIAEADFSVLKWTYIMGVLWGIGGLTYGLGVRYLGVSLGSSVILGLCSVFGSLVPSVYYEMHPTPGKDTISAITSQTWGQFVLLGLAICIVGIFLCGKAGVMKEKDIQGGGEDRTGHGGSGGGDNSEFQIGKGLLVAFISGLLSACFSFGIEAGSSMAERANEVWQSTHPNQGNFLYQNNVIYIVLLWGGLTTNLIWCMMLNFRNKTFGDYTSSKAPLGNNYLFCAMAGTTWFLQFFFYGMGESRMGNGASSWILHMASIIIIANAWGLILKEWDGVSRKTKNTVIAGIVTIILSVLVVGYGNYLKEQGLKKETGEESSYKTNNSSKILTYKVSIYGSSNTNV